MTYSFYFYFSCLPFCTSIMQPISSLTFFLSHHSSSLLPYHYCYRLIFSTHFRGVGLHIRSTVHLESISFRWRRQTDKWKNDLSRCHLRDWTFLKSCDCLPCHFRFPGCRSPLSLTLWTISRRDDAGEQSPCGRSEHRQNKEKGMSRNCFDLMNEAPHKLSWLLVRSQTSLLLFSVFSFVPR